MLDAATALNRHHEIIVAQERAEWKQSCEVLILFLLLFLLMHVKSLHDSLEISVTHDFTPELCSGTVCDDNSAEPTVPAVNSNHNDKTPVKTMTYINNSDYMEISDLESLTQLNRCFTHDSALIESSRDF